MIFDVPGAVLLAVLVVAKRVFIPSMKKGSMSLLEGLRGPAQVELSCVSNLGELCCSLLGLEQVVIGGFDAIVRVAVFAFL